MKVTKYIAVFLSAVLLLTGLLALTAKIPRDALRKNLLESAEYLCEGPQFGAVVEGVEGSCIDRYADSILLGIAWQYDGDRPLESVMRSSYYHTHYQNENKNLLEALTEGKEANQQYLRYWHGSIVLLRPLLTVFSLKQIYLLNAGVMLGLTLWLLGLLCRRKAFVPAVGICLGLILTSAWFVPLSLEYTWTFLVMLMGTIFGAKLAYGKKWQQMGLLFLLLGVLTNYMDFLTTETLTLLVPLLTVLWIDRREKGYRNAVKAILAWGCGYVGMWFAKWLLAALVLGENVMPYVADHVSRRLGGNLGLPLPKYLIGAVVRNIRCLFPLEYGTAGILAALMLVISASYIGYVHQKKQFDRSRVLLFALLGMIPYLRYLILHNHAWLHCFFTYRAQLATILATVMILEELTDWRACPLENAQKRKC